MFFSENFQPKDQIDEFDIKNRLEIIFLSDCFFFEYKVDVFLMLFFSTICVIQLLEIVALYILCLNRKLN